MEAVRITRWNVYSQMNALLTSPTSALDSQVYVLDQGMNAHYLPQRVVEAHFKCAQMETVARIAKRVVTTLTRLYQLVYRCTGLLVLIRVWSNALTVNVGLTILTAQTLCTVLFP